MSFLFGKKSFTVVRGTRWQDRVVLTDETTGQPVSLVGITGLIMRIREFVDSEVLLELSDAPGNGRLAVEGDGSAGAVLIDVATADTLAFPANGHYRATYLYDALIERSANEFEPGTQGKVNVLPTITRAAEDP